MTRTRNHWIFDLLLVLVFQMSDLKSPVAQKVVAPKMLANFFPIIIIIMFSVFLFVYLFYIIVFRADKNLVSTF